MKPKSTLRTFLALAGSSLLTLTCASATTYYWDGNDGNAGFQDAAPGPAGTWSASTPSTATGGFSTDSTGVTAISANPAVGTTTADTVFIGKPYAITDPGPPIVYDPLQNFTGVITIDGTVDVGYLHTGKDTPTMLGINTPTINFAAAGTIESAVVNTQSPLPAGVTLTGAADGLEWKNEFSSNLNIQNIGTNNAGSGPLGGGMILTGPGRLVVNNTLQLGPIGTKFKFNGGVLRMNTGILWTSFSDMNTDHPITWPVDKDVGIDKRMSTITFTVDNDLDIGTGGFIVEGAGNDVVMNRAYLYKGRTYVMGGTLSVELPEHLGKPEADLHIGGGTLKIRGTTLTAMSTIGHDFVCVPDRAVNLNIDDAGHTFAMDEPLVQGTGAFSKSGPGTVNLDQTSNTYTGATGVSGGTLNLSNIPAAVTGLTTVSGTGTLNLSGDNSASTGGVTMNGASASLNLASASASGTGTCTLQAGTLKNSVATLSTTHPINLAGNFTWEGVNNLTFGSGDITNAGSRTMTLNGTNSTLTFGGVMKSTVNGNQTTTVNGPGNTLVLGGYDLQTLNTTNRINVIQGTGNVTITGAVTNGLTSASGLTKSGTGTLTLKGTNTYSGATQINTGGTLALVGGSQSSAITVAAGGSLGFEIGSATTSSSSVNLTNGQVTISNPGAVDNASDYLLMTAATGFTFTDPLTQLGTAITDYELELRNSNTELWLAYAGVSGTPYDTWASTNAPSPQTPDQDFDGDGVINAVEFVLGGDKDTNDLDKLPKVYEDGTNMTFTFERDQTSVDASVSVEIEVGTDLSAWPASYTVGADTGSSDAGVTVTDNLDGTDTIILSVTKAPDAKKFARLKVVVTTP